MRIIASADLHGILEIYDWLVSRVRLESPDAMVLAGDLFGWGQGIDTVADGQTNNRREVLARLSEVECPIFWVMGNDDLIELESPIKSHFRVHGTRVETEGFNFVGYQFSPPFVGGDFEKPEHEIEQDLAQLEHLVDYRTVLVTHCPAHGILDRVRGGQNVGSEFLRDFVDRTGPRAHIHGHIHRQFGHRGIHFNVASAGQRRAMLINLATMTHWILE